MKQVFKNTFDRITMRLETEEIIMGLYNKKQKVRMNYFIRNKIALAMVVIAVFLIPTITVFASGDFYQKAFGKLFGINAPTLQENASLPNYTVINNTFSDLNFEITGIVGDKQALYIAMDITRSDGGSLNLDEYDFNGGIDIRKYLDATASSHSGVNSDDISVRSDSHWIKVPDDNNTDNKISLVYITYLEPNVNGEIQILPGQTIYLKLDSFMGRNKDDRSDILISYGTWEAKFTADYDPADSVSLPVNRVATLPKLSDMVDQFTQKVNVQSINLSSLSLRFTVDELPKDSWFILYIEMKDGSITGYKTFKDYAKRAVLEDQRFMLSGVGNNFCWLFTKPIIIDNVKSVHIGDLEIKIPNRK